jgi:hypothetical protein
MAYVREDMADIRVSIDKVNYPSSDQPGWYSAEGGGLEAEDSKVRPGGMGSEISLGGPASRDDLTLSRPLDDVFLAYHGQLENKVQEDAPVRVSIQYLDKLGHPRAQGPQVITGTLKAATLPDMDGSSGDPAMYEIVVSCDETAAS